MPSDHASGIPAATIVLYEILSNGKNLKKAMVRGIFDGDEGIKVLL